MCYIDEAGDAVISELHYDTDASGDKSFSGSVTASKIRSTVHNSVTRAVDMNIGCKLSWFKHKVVVPSKDGTALLISLENNEWVEKTLVADPTQELSHGSNQLALAQFSPNGSHIVTSDVNGVVLVWDSRTLDPISKYVTASNVALCDIAWGPKEGDNYLLGTTATSLFRVDNVVPVAAAAEEVASSTVVTDVASTATDTAVEAVQQAVESSGVSAAGSKLKRLTKASTNAGDDDDDDVTFDTDGPVWKGDNDDAVTSIKEIKRSYTTLGDDMDDDDDDAVSVDMRDSGYDKVDSSVILKIVEEKMKSVSNNVAKIHHAFQPSSSEVNTQGGKYLVRNFVGHIISLTNRDGSIRLELDFNAKGKNKKMNVPDHDDFKMGALANEGAFFATAGERYTDSDSQEERYRNSIVDYKHFPNHDINNRDFTYNLGDDTAAAIAVGRGWCAVATSKNFLRIFSSTGLQISVTRMMGPVVCMTGCGTYLAVLYNSNPTANYNILVDIFDIQQGIKNLVVQSPVPISPSTTLKWAGFDVASNNLVLMETTGLVSVLMRTSVWEWVPMKDFSREISETVDIWPKFVRDFVLDYDKLNGEKYPAIPPRPSGIQKPLRPYALEDNLPKILKDGKKVAPAKVLMYEMGKLVNYQTEKTQLLPLFGNDEATMQSFMPDLCAKVSKAMTDMDKAILSMFQEICKEKIKNDPRLFELADRLMTPTGINFCIDKLCNTFSQTKVAEFLANKKRQQEEQEEQQRQFIASTSTEYQSSGYVPHDSDYTHDDDYHVSPATTQSQYDSKTVGKRSVVQDHVDTENVVNRPKAIPSNPFLKSSPALSPGKRKTVFENIKELKGSPSPKRPALSRQSPAAQDARKKIFDNNKYI